MNRPNFDTIRSGVKSGVSQTTAMNYVKQCEEYIVHLEQQLGAPAGATLVEADPAPAAKLMTSPRVVPPPQGDTPAAVNRAELDALTARVEALERGANPE